MRNSHPACLRSLIVAVILAPAGVICLSTPPLDSKTQTETSLDQPGSWQVLEPGLEWCSFDLQQKSSLGDSRARVLRIDPAYFDFRLMNASAPGEGKPLTAREWCLEGGLVAAINASMYQADHRRSVALMRTRHHVNNPTLSSDNAVFAFDADSDSLPPVQIIDRQCQDFHTLSQHYGTLVQNIRMISCTGRNVWSQQPRRWSTAAIATDTGGRVLFIHVRSPYSTHDLIVNLLQLPLELKRAMYVEGGPESQLYVRSGTLALELMGSYETGFMESDTNTVAWPVPNVIGIARKE